MNTQGKITINKSFLSQGPSVKEQVEAMKRRVAEATKPQAKHSPLPWSEHDGQIYADNDPKGRTLALIPYYDHEPQQDADAKLIVASVNNAEKLAEACRIAQEYIGGADTSGSAQRRAHSALFVALAAYEEVQS